MLGSGAADGWPNPWCACGSCRSALEQGVVRGQTAALVDDRLLLELGPEAPRAALRHGVSLAGVQLALVTHRHADHHTASGWPWRTWAGAGPLTLLAPQAVLDDAPLDAATTAVRAVPGGQHLLAGYAVGVLEAHHPDGAVLYDVTGPDGGRLLWATDTGVLPAAMVEQARDRAYDLVLLELTGSAQPTHLSLADWPAQVEQLRAVGAVTSRTQVVAIHLGHGNPAPDRLDELLRSYGATAARDGDVLDTAGGHRTLVLGGQSSGKSAHAESLVRGDVVYVATAPPRPGDDDWAERVARHAARRPAGWRTVETGDVAGMLREQRGPVLVDDLGLWLVGVLDGHWDSPDVRGVFDDALAQLADAWSATRAQVVLVSPEVGGGVVPTTRAGRVFADLLGRAATALADRADEVVQVVAGQPRRLR